MPAQMVSSVSNVSTHVIVMAMEAVIKLQEYVWMASVRQDGQEQIVNKVFGLQILWKFRFLVH